MTLAMEGAGRAGSCPVWRFGLMVLQQEKPRGVLNYAAGRQQFRVSLYEPAPDVAFFVEHYWVVAWDLRNHDPYRQENIPHPCVHLVFEPGNSRIVGVMTGRFS